jgi:hypothetical protein
MNAAAKIQMLKSSMQCFAFGLLGLLPVIGLPFAIAALWISGRVRVNEKQFWNAARHYRIWGVVCAAAGTILWSFILMLVIYNAASNSSGHGYYYNGGGDE